MPRVSPTEAIMSTLKQAVRHTALTGALLATVACASAMRVRSYAETGADFNNYRTFKIGSVEATSTGDPRLDDNPFFHNRVKAGVDAMLAARGYERTTGRPDLLVHYHASIHQQIELNDTQQERIDCAAAAAAAIANGTSTGSDPRPPNCLPYVFDAGTLMIDVVDGRTNKLLWRGWAEGSMDGIATSQARMEQQIDKSVKEILEKLPRRL